ncbi:MAG TPA: D-alanine--D-alanine ligase [Gammaproteobacteria bacterium]|nr:D-alanine--D-alanine ligase [Gammaproteobacteria bacterium]
MTAHDIKRFGKVAVLFGGTSAEREISLKSGSAVLRALQARGVDAHAVDPAEGLVEQLLAGRFDRAFIVLHGRDGEDGTVQGLLELMDIPYTGSGVLASALSMDKLRTKQLWQALGLPTPEYVQVKSVEELEGFVARVGYPVAVKPANEGSSIGVTRLTAEKDARAAFELARRYDEVVLAERWVIGKEYFCSILGEQALPMVRMETPREFYDYQAKYFSDDTQYHCPCGLPEEEERELQEMCLAAWKAIGGRGWGRVDFLRDEAGKAWLIEANTVPGMTDHSLVPMSARAVGIEFDELVLRILAQTLEVAR